MMETMYKSLSNKVKEGFATQQGSAVDSIAAFLALIIMVVVHLWIVRFLWNNVMTKVVTVVRPIKTLLETFGLVLLVAMLLMK
jgi:hypothetical protein